MEKSHIDNPIPEGIPAYTFLHNQKPSLSSFTDTQEVLRLLANNDPEQSAFLQRRSPDQVLDVLRSVRSSLEMGMLKLILELKNTGAPLHFHQPEGFENGWPSDMIDKRGFVFPKQEVRTYQDVPQLEGHIASDPAGIHIVDYRPEHIGYRVVLVADEPQVESIRKYVEGVDDKNPIHNGIHFNGDSMYSKFQEWMKIAGISSATEVKQEGEIS